MRKLIYLVFAVTLISSGCASRATRSLNKGKAAYEKHDYLHALEFFNDAVKYDSLNASVYYQRGIAKRAVRINAVGIAFISGQPKSKNPGWNPTSFASEIDDYTRAIQINPVYKEAFFSRAMARIESHQADSACSDFRIAIELGSSDAKEAISEYCK